MHVTLYLKHFPASGTPLVGGTSIAVDGLATGLAQNGAGVTVLCEGKERSSLKTSAGYAIECFPNHNRYRTFEIGSALKWFAAARLSSGSGICLINGMFHPAAYAMGRWLHRQAIPYVAVPHDPYDQAVFRRNGHLKWPYWYLFERSLLKRAKAVQVLDMKHAASLRCLGIETPVIEAPNGVAAARVPAESELHWRPADETLNLIFLGRIDAYNKGLDTLIDACARVATDIDLRITIQGPDWGDRSRLERRVAAWGMAERVEFRDPDYRKSSPQIIAEHDVFCLPSRFEGFGLAALEAMLAGRVLLVSERAGIARHVRAGQCGELVRPTVSGLEAGLLALWQKRAQWREMGISGRRYALANLQWKNIAASALGQYQQLLSQS